MWFSTCACMMAVQLKRQQVVHNAAARLLAIVPARGPTLPLYLWDPGAVGLITMHGRTSRSVCVCVLVFLFKRKRECVCMHMRQHKTEKKPRIYDIQYLCPSKTFWIYGYGKCWISQNLLLTCNVTCHVIFYPKIKRKN